MKYVIIRDDDTNALTPTACLERLYRPFLARELPVNLAVIPHVNTRATWRDGSPEGFLVARTGTPPPHLPIGSNLELVHYLKSNPGYGIVHHGFEHDYLEFMRSDRAEIVRRLDLGTEFFVQAGLGRPSTFVAPYDQFSKASLQAVSERFKIISTGWFEWRRLPVSWWPPYLLKKIRAQPHWRVGQVRLLSHPGCLLSHKRDLGAMLDSIKTAIAKSELTVLVTHWWEYFPNNQPFDAYISVLHQTAEYLASQPDIKVISFEALAKEGH